MQSKQPLFHDFVGTEGDIAHQCRLLPRTCDVKSLEKLLVDLEGVGFFDYVRTDQVHRAKETLLQHNEILHEITNRASLVDGESIAEGGVRAFLRDTRLLFNVRGIPTDNVIDSYSDAEGYCIEIDDKRLRLWDSHEYRNSDSWFLCTTRIIKAFNKILEIMNCEDRIFFDYGGNDVWIFMLSEEIFRVLETNSVLTRE